MKIMNKKGSKTINTVLILVAVVALVVMAYGVNQSMIGNKPVGLGHNDGTVGCNIAPSINTFTTDTLVSGTTPTISNSYSIYDGSYVGSIPSTPSYGKSLDVIASASGYLNAESKIASIQCAGNDLKFDFIPYAAPTIVVKNADSNTLATATLNETASANQIVDTVRLTGTPLKSTGDMLVIVEYANKTEVKASDISMKGASRENTPDWYNPSSTLASVATFTVPSIVNGGLNDYSVTLNPSSGQTIGASSALVKVTAYTLNPVILDTNTGKFLTSNTWQDTLGNSEVIESVSTEYFIE